MYLSDKKVQHATPKTRPYKLSDGDGLYLFVQPSGSKLWRMKYHFGGIESVLSIGKYPFVSLEEARERRYHTKKLLLANINPNNQKRQEKHAVVVSKFNSFRSVAEDWHRTNYKKWTVEHAERLWRRLELHALPTIGIRPIAEIKTTELVQLLRRLEKKGKPETAMRLAQTLRVVFRYGIHSGILQYNPAADLRGVVAPYRATHFAAIEPVELPPFLAALETTPMNIQNRIAVKLLLHTFVRPGELRFGSWAEIDWEKKQWVIPAERMKKRRPHVVPLTEPALALLHDLQPISGYSTYLFPSQQRCRHPVMSENTINKIITNMGYGGRQVGHGFRAIASTVLNESALFRPDVIEMQLAHVEESSSRKPYNRAEYLPERTTMMAWWSDYLLAAGGKAANR